MADCAHCDDKACYQGRDCFGISELASRYRGDIAKIHNAASTIEAKFYCQKTRIEEAVELLKMLDVRKVGVAFCIGLSEEARIIADIFAKVVPEVVSVCCKCGGISKKSMSLPHIRPDRYEAICNPIGQAHVLNRAKTELNFAVGLCVGHDAVFTAHSNAPVVTLIAKDRVTGHNPAAALYVRYLRRKLP